MIQETTELRHEIDAHKATQRLDIVGHSEGQRGRRRVSCRDRNHSRIWAGTMEEIPPRAKRRRNTLASPQILSSSFLLRPFMTESP